MTGDLNCEDFIENYVLNIELAELGGKSTSINSTVRF